MSALFGEVVGLLAPVLALLPLYLVHLVVIRFDPARSLNRSFIISFALVCPALLALGAIGISLHGSWSLDSAARLAVDLVIFVGCAYNYVDFLNFGDSSIRTRILDEIGRGPGGSLSMDELLARYDARTVMDLRLSRLVANGQLEKRGDRYALGPNRNRQLLLAHAFRWLRRLLFGTDAITSRSTRTPHEEGQS